MSDPKKKVAPVKAEHHTPPVKAEHHTATVEKLDPRNALATQFLASMICGNPHMVDTNPKSNQELVAKAYAMADTMLESYKK